jgi:hypothetical protein
MSLRVPNPLARLERKARAALKTSPENRRLERKKNVIVKKLAAGKFSNRQANDLTSVLRLRRRRLVNREVYRLMCESSAPA